MGGAALAVVLIFLNCQRLGGRGACRADCDFIEHGSLPEARTSAHSFGLYFHADNAVCLG